MRETIKEALEILKEDWEKLSSFPKFCFFAALLVIVMIFAIDANASVFNRPYQFWLGILVITLLALPCLYWTYIELRIRLYRWLIFPLRTIGTKYEFRYVDGHNAVLIVYGKDKKKARWIENGRTMYDLGFEPYYRKFAAKTAKSKDNFKKLKLRRGLRTRRIPGGLSKENS